MNDVVPLLKHTPSAQDPEILEAITVQREATIASLVDVVLDPGGLRHQLLVGPRGMGKTHILSLVVSRVRRDPRAADAVLAWLDEDPWAIRTYDKFLAEIAASVAAEIGDAELAERARDLRAGDGTRSRDGEEAVRAALGRRRLILLVENLDEIFRRIGDEGQSRFRALVEDWRQLLIVATSPQLFEDVQRHSSPFYGFFTITHLEELSLDSAAELLRRVADLNGDEELRRFLGSELAHARLEAIESLAGGHPRVWLLLAGCVSIAAIEELVPLFLEALDELTPYYQDRLRELGDQQQEIVVLLSEAGGALSNRELADRSGIPQNQIATILKHLAERGYVRKAEVDPAVATGDRRMAYWELREPLMRLCLDVKQARGKPLRMVVEFLRAWYGPRILDEMAKLPPGAELATAYAGEAFLGIEGGVPREDLLRGSGEEIIERAERGLALVPDRQDLRLAKVAGLLLEDRADEAVDFIASQSRDAPAGYGEVVLAAMLGRLGLEDADADLVERALGVEVPGADNPALVKLIAAILEMFGLEQDALLALGRAVKLDPGDRDLLLEYGMLAGYVSNVELALSVFDRVLEIEPDNADAWAGKGASLRRLDRLDEALRAHRRAVELDSDNAFAQDSFGTALSEAQLLQESLQAHVKATELAPESGAFRNNLAAARGRLDDLPGALADSRAAIELGAPEAIAYANLGITQERLGMVEESVASFRRAVEAGPGNKRFHGMLGDALVAAGNDEEALAVFRQMEERWPDDPRVLASISDTLLRLRRDEEALAVLERNLELDPANHRAQRHRAVALINLDRGADALAAVEAALELQPEDVGSHVVRGVTLLNLGRNSDALDALDRAATLGQLSGFGHAKRGTALQRLGRLEEAVAASEEALKSTPGSVDAHNQLADALRALGRIEQAEEAARRAIELDPNAWVARFTLAEILLSNGPSAAALGAFEDALDCWRQHGEGHLPGDPRLLSRILWDRGREWADRAGFLAQLGGAYRRARALEHLATGLVESIPWYVDPEVGVQDAEQWVAAWAQAAESGDELQIPLTMLQAALAWKRDGDRAHLLALPAEQREIVVGLLPGDTSG